MARELIFSVQAMAPQYPDVLFLKVDVDAAADAAEWAKISAMPTFKAYAHGAEIGEIVGASEEKLKALIQKLADHS